MCNPYFIYTCDDIVSDTESMSSQEIIEIKNSLGVFKYIQLKNSISLAKFSSYELMGIGYYNEPNKTYSFHIENRDTLISYRTSGLKFFFELLDSPILIDNNSNIFFKNNIIASDIPVLMQRDSQVYDDIQGINISYMLFRKKDLRIVLPHSKQNNDLDLTSLLNGKLKKVQNLFTVKQTKKNLENKIDKTSKSADILRDVAIAFEEIGDIVTAKSLMCQAQLLRPSGVTINKKIKKYDKILADKFQSNSTLIIGANK